MQGESGAKENILYPVTLLRLYYRSQANWATERSVQAHAHSEYINSLPLALHTQW